MDKVRRPFQDETLLLPTYRHLYAATFLGHLSGDPHEEPLKLTQTFCEGYVGESYQEWHARLSENSMMADLFMKGKLVKEIEGLKKMDEWMDSSGLGSTVEGLESGDVDAVDGIESAMGMAGEESTLEVIDDILTEDMITSYGFHPPIINLPLRMSPALIVMLLGTSLDNFYHDNDTFTLEQNPFLEDWHYEEGIQTARITVFYENAEHILERRHLRTGEKFRYLCVQRAMEEGEYMITDILKDIRNEKFPEYSDSDIGAFPFSSLVSPECQNVSRSMIDMLVTMIIGTIAPIQFGWSFRPHNAWVPFPGLIRAVSELPLDLMLPRMINLLTGVNFWIGKYNLTHLEVSHEVVGQEMITPMPEESGSAYMRFGMDRIRYTPSFIQSKRIYGQDAQVMVREPTELPTPERVVKSFGKANEEIKKAREEHPEWLTDVKGFGN
ncbi:MAG: hypothetical protein SVM80_05165 [Halobacteriota archaeon]|nr:hypothetical protein [Halobacteriota archaeon]